MSDATTVPIDRLYWAIVEAPPRGRRWRSDEIASLAEDVIPVSVEALHIIERRLRDGRTVVCAIERDDLESRCAGLPELIPAEVPDFVQSRVDEPLRPQDFDLLIGAFTPPEVRRAIRRLTITVAAIAALLGIALTAGFIVRGLAARRALETVDARRTEIVGAVMDQTATGRPSALPPELRLVAELRELRSTRSSALPHLEDPSSIASSALGAWPSGISARLDRAKIAPNTVSLEGWAKDSGDAQRVADALGAIPGVRLEPPQVRAGNDGVTFTIVLTPTSKSGGWSVQ